MKLVFLSVNVNLNNETLVVRPRPGLGLAWPITKRCPLPFLSAPCLSRLAYTPKFFLSVFVAFLSFLPFTLPFSSPPLSVTLPTARNINTYSTLLKLPNEPVALVRWPTEILRPGI
jgi:hypothetical protein